MVIFHSLREVDRKLYTNIFHELELKVHLLCEMFVVTCTTSTPTCTLCLCLFETIFVFAFQTQPLQFHLKEEESIQLFSTDVLSFIASSFDLRRISSDSDGRQESLKRRKGRMNENRDVTCLPSEPGIKLISWKSIHY